MNKSTKIIVWLSLVVVAVIVVSILLRRRGKKVYIANKYRLNPKYQIYLYDRELNNSHYFEGNLDYVILPYNYKTLVFNGEEVNKSIMYPVEALGLLLPNGELQKVRMKDYLYIDQGYLDFTL